MDRERPEPDGKARPEKVRALRDEALEALDAALKAPSGPERMLLMNKALELRRWALEVEAQKDDED